MRFSALRTLARRALDINLVYILHVESLVFLSVSARRVRRRSVPIRPADESNRTLPAVDRAGHRSLVGPSCRQGRHGALWSGTGIIGSGRSFSRTSATTTRTPNILTAASSSSPEVREERAAAAAERAPVPQARRPRVRGSNREHVVDRSRRGAATPGPVSRRQSGPGGGGGLDESRRSGSGGGGLARLCTRARVSTDGRIHVARATKTFETRDLDDINFKPVGRPVRRGRNAKLRADRTYPTPSYSTVPQDHGLGVRPRPYF